MSDDHAVRLWFGLALAAGMVAAPGLLAGGFPLLPLVLVVAGLTCSAHRPSRLFLMEKLDEAFSGSRIRSLIIFFGAIMMIQILPVELALLMAGDVLAYVEVVAAVSLIAGQARWPLLKARVKSRVQAVLGGVWRRPIARSRRPAPCRRPTRPSSADDDAGAAWGPVGGWALA